MDNLSISFSGCAWHCAFHFGVTTQLQKYFDTSKIAFLGASSGAMSAAAAACNIDGSTSFRLLRQAAEKNKHRKIGPFGQMSKILLEAMESLTPDPLPEIHERLFISVTELPSFRNKLLPNKPLDSRAELFKIIQASTYIPLYYEQPAVYNGRPYLDGGITNNQPILNRQTVRVSPYKSESSSVDLHPRFHPPYTNALFPKLEILDRLFEEGQQDGEVFFKNLIQRRGSELPLK